MLRFYVRAVKEQRSQLLERLPKVDQIYCEEMREDNAQTRRILGRVVDIR